MYINFESIWIYLKLLQEYFRNILQWFHRSKGSKNLNGKVVVITGSANGIGREMCRLLNRFGCHLAMIDIDHFTNKELASNLSSSSPSWTKTIAYKCDLTNLDEIDLIVGQILLDFDHIDILINNAGYVNCKRIGSLSQDEIRRTFDVNILSSIWLCKQLLPSMIENREGHIVAISSIAGLLGNANLVDYCASKHAVIGMMKALELELDAQNLNFIKLTTICPLMISTGMFRKLHTRFQWLYPILTPESVAKSILDSIVREDFLVTIPKHCRIATILERFAFFFFLV
ncbi:epidermal retinol dehydrogenase 2-like protein 2 [Sarcoptes scabiei]|uniref:Short-chain dehydrogenase/reductase 3 n=1 Tax=Sarcoptes scabiei TaxID=52283 RepID=A0A132A411_SARSC|nr:epidermal retinol dehydrogenase 2-like protein 2 [Sarcoptes scabiei]